MLVLAVWRDGLKTLADAVGVHSPPNALFLVALGVVFILLLHFSIATSRLSEETKILAQEVARLDAEAKAAREAARTAARRREALARRLSAAGQAAGAEQPSTRPSRHVAPPAATRDRPARAEVRRLEVGGEPAANSRAPTARVAWMLRPLPRAGAAPPGDRAQAAASAPNQPPAIETGTSASSVASERRREQRQQSRPGRCGSGSPTVALQQRHLAGPFSNS